MTKAKKIVISASIAVIFILLAITVMLISTMGKLNQAEAKLGKLVLVENCLTANSEGGLITASQSWVYYSDTNCITQQSLPAPDGKISEILSILVKQGRLTALQGNLITLKYEKIITVENGDYKKIFYSVGEYFITAE